MAVGRLGICYARRLRRSEGTLMKTGISGLAGCLLVRREKSLSVSNFRSSFSGDCRRMCLSRKQTLIHHFGYVVMVSFLLSFSHTYSYAGFLMYISVGTYTRLDRDIFAHVYLPVFT